MLQQQYRRELALYREVLPAAAAAPIEAAIAIRSVRAPEAHPGTANIPAVALLTTTRASPQGTCRPVKHYYA